MSTTRITGLTLTDLLARFAPYGGTDIPYLAHHFGRFAATLAEFDGSWDPRRGVRVLDVGAHWLHQSLLWRLAGYDVTAVDLPITFEFENVQALAAGEGIALLPCADLARADVLDVLPDNSVNVLPFTEIIEHLTFNPVAFWRQIYRVLAPQGRIVITTANYYAWNGLAWNIKRFVTGFGGGLSVDEVLGVHTYGHHWREFSRLELIRYFCLLSRDFVTVKAKTTRDYYAPDSRSWRRRLGRGLEAFASLRPNLHLEIELVEKRHGIVIEPQW